MCAPGQYHPRPDPQTGQGDRRPQGIKINGLVAENDIHKLVLANQYLYYLTIDW
jgi:hypothetical protein